MTFEELLNKLLDLKTKIPITTPVRIGDADHGLSYGEVGVITSITVENHKGQTYICLGNETDVEFDREELPDQSACGRCGPTSCGNGTAPCCSGA